VFPESVKKNKSTVDRGYLISSVRHQLVSSGALLKEDEKTAEFMVELRAGGIGTDRATFLIGTPAITMPAILPGVPSSIPEIALYKRNDQKGVAKIGVFAYQRATGRAVWQTDIVQEASTLKDRWIFGSGPYSSGSIRKKTEFAGEELPAMPKIPLISQQPHTDPAVLPATITMDVGPPITAMGLLGGAPAGVAATR